MKKITILTLLLSLMTLTIFGQTTKEAELSKAEEFSLTSGALIEKKFYDVGAIQRAEMQVVKYTDLISSTSISSVKIKYKSYDTYSSTKVALLDSDEIEGLIKSIKLMQTKIFASTPSSYTEVSYQSRSGFEAGCFWGSNNEWKTYIKLEKYDSKSIIRLEQKDYTTLLNLLEKATELL